MSIKKSKKGPLKQVVLSYSSLKNNYTLLWDMKNNNGYVNVVAVMQKFFDQAISGNWSYNPENYPDNEVPVSVMAQDFLNTYKYGWKTSYYQNTYDNKTDEVKEEPENSKLDDILNELTNSEEETVKAVQFKVSPEMMNKSMTEVKRLTVFNIAKLIPRNNQCFLVNRWEFKDTILISIQSLKS